MWILILIIAGLYIAGTSKKQSTQTGLLFAAIGGLMGSGIGIAGGGSAIAGTIPCAAIGFVIGKLLAIAGGTDKRPTNSAADTPSMASRIAARRKRQDRSNTTSASPSVDASKSFAAYVICPKCGSSVNLNTAPSADPLVCPVCKNVFKV
jgi:hypothetical protein